VPRYGEGVNGGSEALVRRLAQALAGRRWEVEVWTTTARDEQTWSPAFPAGDDMDGPVRLRRFPVVGRRQPEAFRQLSRVVFRLPANLRPETPWVGAQGPFAPALIRALASSVDRPTVFMPYLYYPTLWGLPAAPHPRLLIPAAHDEPPLRLRAVARAVAAADGLWYSTEEERGLLEGIHPVAARRPHAVGTVGMDPSALLDENSSRAAAERFRGRHGLSRYLLYAGRLTPGKGVDLLLDGYKLLRPQHPEVSLVLIGDAAVPDRLPPGAISLGWVDDQERLEALAGAAAVIVTSRLESLSLVALEAWGCGRPCLLNGASPVLSGQAERSGGALLFDSPASLADAAAQLLDDPAAADQRGAAGRRYVALHHRWGEVIRRLEGLLAATARSGTGEGRP